MRKRKLVLQILLFSFLFLGVSLVILQNVFNDHSVVYAEGPNPGWFNSPNNNTSNTNTNENKTQVNSNGSLFEVNSDFSGLVPEVDKKYKNSPLVQYKFWDIANLKMDWMYSEKFWDELSFLDQTTYAGWILGIINKILWFIYAFFVYWIIQFVAWAFNLELIDKISNQYDLMIQNVEDALFKPFLFFMFAIAIAWMVYYYATSKKQKLWNTVINTLIILGISTTSLLNLGSYIRFWTKVSSMGSSLVFEGLAEALVNGELNNSSQSDDLQNLTAVIPSDAGGVAVPQKVDNGEYDLDQSTVERIHTAMWNILVIEPYKLATFGSIEYANEPLPNSNIPRWQAFLQAKDREQHMQEYYISKAENGEDPRARVFTPYGALTRTYNIIFIIIFGAILIFCFLRMAARVLLWQAIAIGRSLMGAYYLLLSLWPEYGLKEAIQWYWGMIQALLMKMFYSVVLGAYIILVGGLLGLVDDYGLINMFVLSWLLFWGLDQAVKELREKFVQIPLGDGVYLSGDKGQADGVVSEKLTQAAGVALAGAGLAAGSAVAAKAGIGLATGGAKGMLTSLANSNIERLERRQQGQGQPPQPQPPDMQPNTGDQQGQRDGSGSTAQDNRNTRQRKEENQTQQFNTPQEVLQHFQQQQVAELSVDIQAKIDDLRNELKRLEGEWEIKLDGHWKALDSIQDKKLHIDILLDDKAVEILRTSGPDFGSIDALSNIYKRKIYPKYAPTAIRNEIPED